MPALHWVPFIFPGSRASGPKAIIETHSPDMTLALEIGGERVQTHSGDRVHEHVLVAEVEVQVLRANRDGTCPDQATDERKPLKGGGQEKLDTPAEGIADRPIAASPKILKREVCIAVERNTFVASANANPPVAKTRT
jgi:hypothetical protein